MMKLQGSNIQLHARAENKADAIRQVGRLLVDNGHIKPGYIESMLGREKIANTFLGNGIAIPHGLPKDRELILQTGIAVMQIPEGVAWNPGETVYLVVGIAARSDEHIEILTNLTHVLDDEKLVQQLATTDDAEAIVTCLTRMPVASPAAAPPSAVLSDFDKSIEVTVSGEHGLHARPATAFVDLAKQFKAAVHVRHKAAVADGKSLVSLLKLGAGKNATLCIMAKGEDADAALAALHRAVLAGLEDEDSPEAKPLAVDIAHDWSPTQATETIQGLSASPGLAIGPICQIQRHKIVVAATAKDPAVEQERLYHAIATAQGELDQIYQEVKTRSSAGQAAIFKAHIEFLNDTEIIAETIAHIRSGHSAGWSWQQVLKVRVEAMAQLDDPVLAGRAVDLEDVGNRVLRHLAQVVDDTAFAPRTPVILVAEDLTPSDTAGLDPASVLGFCTASGGPTSHTAIIARSLGIPAIVGAGPALLKQKDGVRVILDGDNGKLYIEPDETDIQSAQRVQAILSDQRDSEHQARFEPAITEDGHRMEVVANIAGPAEAEQAVNAGAEGVGLLRTEFLFLDRPSPPSEEEQYQAYRRAVEFLGGLPLIIRTLDIGGDKNVPYLHLPPEDTSFMGIRGIRLCLTKPELFYPQLRAIYRAARHGPIKIMFPMIATLEDLNAAKDMADQVRNELGAPEIPFGIMIEVPSAVAMAEELAREVEFFSIGTNDLTQYTLAMDRLHPMLARQADALHPAVLRMIAQTIRAATSAGIWVGVCGGMAADPQGAVILTGLGVRELSVSIPSVAAIKAQLRRITLSDAQSLARRALACPNAATVRRLTQAKGVDQ
ncbi:Multiphosphoryl transfer protein (Includes: Phosphoenolpyruvate-protein phosphotransferase; Phosphocarrier protein HPr; Fructose-specific phosphotransferase enzyme IIA component) [Desulfosarcina cetonica]|nr:Multiphosphoryl transfer protein (Includes: Phosphoenolpyruvate-protein phosphotransferase; Phosphocarrier protein HPr; Fructose-specific phosphotransferase enzyme IIA component) [Desulfosarcina cetonica]